MVLDAVHALEHPTAQEVYAYINIRFCSLEENEENISLGTIYRNLQVLEDEGSIASLAAGRNATRYDTRLDAHYHLLCVKCGRMRDLPVVYKHTFNLDAEKSSGCLIESHSVLFKGVCNDCLEAKLAVSWK
jgi:Fur family peroxide stress response transcriptional regulator